VSLCLRCYFVSCRKKHVPPYPHRSKLNFIPTELADYEDGGAYPEIHVVQYPLKMGQPGVKSTAVIAVNVDEKGQVSYDALVKQGANKNKLIQTSLEDIKEKTASKEAIAMPDEKEEQEAVDKTRQALEALLDGKIKSTKPTTVNLKPEAEEPTYIRYTPNPNAPGFSAEAKQRVIRMVEAQVDPMEPPKHKHKKVPKGPGSPPVPVLHSPPRKITVADQQAWKVPACVSNWKNARGYTIPLDKRLAADGRGLQEVTINNKFAQLSEALYISERKAAEDLRIRNQIRKKLAVQEKEDKEQQLREMALKSRMERAGISADEINARMAEGGLNDEDDVDQFLAGRAGNDVDVIDRPLSSSSQQQQSSSSHYQQQQQRSEGRPQGRRPVDNRPAWMSQAEDEKENERLNSDSDSGSDRDRRARSRSGSDWESSSDEEASNRRRSRSSSPDDRRRRNSSEESTDRNRRNSSGRRDRSDSRDRKRDSRDRNDRDDRDNRDNRDNNRSRREDSRDRNKQSSSSRRRDDSRDRRDSRDRSNDRNRDRERSKRSDSRDRNTSSSKKEDFKPSNSRYYMKDNSPSPERKSREDKPRERGDRDREGERDRDREREREREKDRRSSRDDEAGHGHKRSAPVAATQHDGGDDEGDDADLDGLSKQEREKIRLERRKERERQLRLENMKVSHNEVLCFVRSDGLICLLFVAGKFPKEQIGSRLQPRCVGKDCTRNAPR
jgi:hypothetical protein